VRVPPAQDALHALQRPQADMTQSTGQRSGLQMPASLSCGQGTPPKTGARDTVLKRARKPLPHVAEQGVHAVQGAAMQSTGHALL